MSGDHRKEITYHLKEKFDVEYHPDYLGKYLRELGLAYAKPRLKRPNRPENPEEILDEDDIPHNKQMETTKKGGLLTTVSVRTVQGFFDASQPQPYDNPRRVWYVDDPHVERPLVKTESIATSAQTTSAM